MPTRIGQGFDVVKNSNCLGNLVPEEDSYLEDIVL